MCLYCYATSYIGLKKSRPKRAVIKRLMKDLKEARRELTVSMSNSSDPYPPEERRSRITRDCLRLLISHGFKVLIITKGSTVLRDLDLLRRGMVSVSMTITSLNEELTKIIEPGAPPPMERLRTLRKLSEGGVPVSVRIDPIIPGLNDDPKEIWRLVKLLSELGVKHVVSSTYKARPDNLQRMMRAFPAMAERFLTMYKDEGVRVRGYWYLKRKVREELLKPVVEAAQYYGLTYAVCREGLTSKKFFNAPTCDGSHLILAKSGGGSP